ncbi:claudin-8 [Syngnathoides biaculeatus]|uniref:claudin-8 n=1 Tax=Syngnathoides biaculeatus TaxID=300417 RepID=UPI002ADE587D|nr:claudin-8 [Syngnathoides biaculeatus]
MRQPQREGLNPTPPQSLPQLCGEQEGMANPALEILGFLLSLIGLIGAAASTGMPMWRVTAFIGENIIVFETRYEGLWMNCFKQADIRMQCKVYDSLLALPPDLQAARGLMCCALALAGLGLLVSLVGLQCTSCVRNNDRAKRLVLIIAGSMIITACICVLIPVSWTAHVIIRDFYNPLLIDAQRRELGEALYIGWVAGAFLFAGGCVFTCCNVQSEGKDTRRYVYSRNSDYVAYSPQPVQPLQPQQLVLLPQVQAQPVLSRHPSSNYSYPSRYPSVRSGVAYL